MCFAVRVALRVVGAPRAQAAKQKNTDEALSRLAVEVRSGTPIESTG